MRKCSLCPRKVTLVHDVLCLECFLDSITKDCQELRDRMFQLQCQQAFMQGLIRNATIVPAYPTSTPFTETDHQEVDEFMGQEGQALLDRLDWMFIA